MFENISMRDAALKYAEMGLAVFPLKERSKEPIYNNGFKIATTDRDKICMWWSQNPNANIGIACGDMSNGLTVIDCDKHEEKDEDGYRDFNRYAREHGGTLPDTLTITTGSGGTQFYFFSKEKKYRNRVRVWGSIDVRANGGYVVAPPSIHPVTGEAYEFDGAELGEVDISEVEPWIDQLINEGPSDNYNKKIGFELPDKIPSGARNDTLFKYACKLRHAGLDDLDLETVIRNTNEKRCDIPLDDDDIRKIVESACKYEQGALIVPSGHGELSAQVVERNPQLATNDQGKVIQSIANCEEVIEFDRYLAGRIAFNELNGTLYVKDYLPWDENGYKEREWRNNDDNNLMSYLEGYGLKNKEKILTGLSNVAYRHSFHPVRDMLNEIAKNYQIRKGSIEKLMPKYLGADKSHINTKMLELWMVGAVARAFEPGVKFDEALILVGEQGTGKSSFISRMAVNPRFYNDNLSTIEGDKAFEKIQGVWIAEMAELLAYKSAKDVEAMKAFITSQNDRYRKAYDRRIESHLRQCVFAGTTNEDFFLVDTTGNRRFLPVRVHRGRTTGDIWSDEALEDIKYAWAEAVALYRNGYSLAVPRELEYQIELQRSQFQEENVKKGIIEDWISKKVETNGFICVAMVRADALGEDKSKMDMKTSKEIGGILNSLNNMIIPVGKHWVSGYGVQQAWQKIDFADQ